MSTATYIPAHIHFKLADAEQFIQTRIERDSSVNGFRPIVRIEPEIRQFELLPCLIAAKKAAVNCPLEYSEKIVAIKALRTAAQARGFQLGLADCKAIVEQFICLK